MIVSYEAKTAKPGFLAAAAAVILLVSFTACGGTVSDSTLSRDL